MVGAGVLGRRVAKLWRQEMPQAKVRWFGGSVDVRGMSGGSAPGGSGFSAFLRHRCFKSFPVEVRRELQNRVVLDLHGFTLS